MRKVCSIILTLLLTLLLTLAVVPCFASEADLEAARSSAPMPEAVETPALAKTPAPEENLVEEETPVSTDASVQKAAAMRASNAAVTIHVTVPARGNMIINPYSLPIEIGDRTTTEQIAGEILTIYNDSEVPVSISANARGRIYELSNAVYVSTPPAAGTLEKQIFLYAEFQNEESQWTGSYISANNQILISTQASGPREVLQLDAYSEGVFRLFGSTAAYPDEPWDRNDKIVVQLAFTFSAAESSVTAISDEEQSAPEDASAPEEPIEVPEASAEMPEEPVEMPEAPAETSEEPVGMPEEPSEAPAEESETESGGSATEIPPVDSTTEPVENRSIGKM